MAMEQYFEEAVALNSSCQDHASAEKWKSISTTLDDDCENKPSSGFDCNICLESVQDPVVTLCGHLYCWPCVYKWIQFKSTCTENLEPEQPQCPVCKSEISKETLIPLYGRGCTEKSSESKAPHLGIVIPRRPSPTCGANAFMTNATTAGSQSAQQLHRYQQQSHQYDPTPMLSLGGTMTANAFHPMAGMFGEMVYARIFGNSETTLYTYPNSYHLMGSSSPRVRRRLRQADTSLSRVCFFLFCCVVLCLLLF